MNLQSGKQKMYLKAEAILKYLLGKSEEIDTLIMCKSSEIDLVTSDQSLYEAIGSIKERNKIDYNKLVKLLEVTEVISFKKDMRKKRNILTEERVDELNKKVEEGKK